jgi:hypothetical protein
MAFDADIADRAERDRACLRNDRTLLASAAFVLGRPGIETRMKGGWTQMHANGLCGPIA